MDAPSVSHLMVVNSKSDDLGTSSSMKQRWLNAWDENSWDEPLADEAQGEKQSGGAWPNLPNEVLESHVENRSQEANVAEQFRAMALQLKLVQSQTQGKHPSNLPQLVEHVRSTPQVQLGYAVRPSNFVGEGQRRVGYLKQEMVGQRMSGESQVFSKINWSLTYQGELATLWIRDYQGLSLSGLRKQLAEMHSVLASQDVSISRVMLNGHELWFENSGPGDTNSVFNQDQIDRKEYL